MSDQGAANAGEARARAQAILNRAKGDEGFLKQLKDDPVATLEASGFLTEEAREFSQELVPGDVSGYLKCENTCDRYSCWITACGYVPRTN